MNTSANTSAQNPNSSRLWMLRLLIALIVLLAGVLNFTSILDFLDPRHKSYQAAHDQYVASRKTSGLDQQSPKFIWREIECGMSLPQIDTLLHDAHEVRSVYRIDFDNPIDKKPIQWYVFKYDSQQNSFGYEIKEEYIVELSEDNRPLMVERRLRGKSSSSNYRWIHQDDTLDLTHCDE